MSKVSKNRIQELFSNFDHRFRHDLFYDLPQTIYQLSLDGHHFDFSFRVHTIQNSPHDFEGIRSILISEVAT